MVTWPWELPVQKFVEIFMPFPRFPCEAAGCVQGLAVGQAPTVPKEQPLFCPTPQKPFKGGGINKGQFCRVPPQKHIRPQCGSAEPGFLQRSCGVIAKEGGQSLSHHHTPLADKRLDTLHYDQELQPACQDPFCNPKM